MLLQDRAERQPATPAGRHRPVAVHPPGRGVRRGEARLPAAQDRPGRRLLREDHGAQEKERQAEGHAVGGGEGRGGIQQHGGHQLRKGEVGGFSYRVFIGKSSATPHNNTLINLYFGRCH